MLKILHPTAILSGILLQNIFEFTFTVSIIRNLTIFGPTKWKNVSTKKKKHCLVIFSHKSQITIWIIVFTKYMFRDVLTFSCATVTKSKNNHWMKWNDLIKNSFQLNYYFNTKKNTKTLVCDNNLKNTNTQKLIN